MNNVISAAKKLVELGHMGVEQCHLNNLEVALSNYNRQLAKYADIQRVRILKSFTKKAKYGSRVFDAEFAPGDTATIIMRNMENLRLTTDDPAHVEFSLALCEEGKTWEYFIKSEKFREKTQP